MYDPHTRDSRGFGFVTMETGEEADAAITALNATEMMGKTMTVEKAGFSYSSQEVRLIKFGYRLVGVAREPLLLAGTMDHPSGTNVCILTTNMFIFTELK
jgi:hypothetical protein